MMLTRTARFGRLFTAAGVTALLGSCAFARPQAPAAKNRVPLPFGTDLQGRPLQRLAPAGVRAVVLYFAATDCPVSNRYTPYIAELSERLKARGVEILSVYPNPNDTPSAVRAHVQQYGPAGETVLDPQQSLVRLAHARLTPEAAVLVADASGWREVYLGRIDDRYLALGRERSTETRHDLQDALEAALAHRAVPPPGGPAVGCAIVPLP